jgi:hypothetical protein
MFRAVPIATSAGLRIIGLSGSRDVPVLRLDGGADGVRRGERYELPTGGNVWGGPASEILLPYRHGVRVYSPGGTLLEFVPGLQFFSDQTFVQADGDAELEIVFVRMMGRTVDVRIANGDGSLVRDWTGNHRTWLSFIPDLGIDRVWGLTSAGFVAFDAHGREVEAYPAEGAGYLRDVTGARVGEYLNRLLTQLLGWRCILNKVSNELHHQSRIVPVDHVSNVARNNEHPFRGRERQSCRFPWLDAKPAGASTFQPVGWHRRHHDNRDSTRLAQRARLWIVVHHLRADEFHFRPHARRRVRRNRRHCWRRKHGCSFFRRDELGLIFAPQSRIQGVQQKQARHLTRILVDVRAVQQAAPRMADQYVRRLDVYCL